jgi:hypothetical protein
MDLSVFPETPIYYVARNLLRPAEVEAIRLVTAIAPFSVALITNLLDGDMAKMFARDVYVTGSLEGAQQWAEHLYAQNNWRSLILFNTEPILIAHYLSREEEILGRDYKA